VDDRNTFKWCPSPNCEYAVECQVKQTQLAEIVPTVTCECGHVFCFGCSLPDHKPSICGLVKLWLKKCQDDSETANWMSANTKECIKCGSTIKKMICLIELKLGGCNHMTCRKCKHEFCWICSGPWSDHGTQWYTCNRFDEKGGVEARDSQAKSRRDLERYLHVSRCG
jgi:ariadne-1